MKRIFSLWLIAGGILLSSSCILDFEDQGIIATPYNNQSVSGVQTILITAPENVIVDEVYIYVDSGVLDYITAEPWQTDWDTFNYTNGWHTISAELYGQLGEYYSNSIQVLVNNE